MFSDRLIRYFFYLLKDPKKGLLCIKKRFISPFNPYLNICMYICICNEKIFFLFIQKVSFTIIANFCAVYGQLVWLGLKISRIQHLKLFTLSRTKCHLKRAQNLIPSPFVSPHTKRLYEVNF